MLNSGKRICQVSSWAESRSIRPNGAFTLLLYLMVQFEHNATKVSVVWVYLVACQATKSSRIKEGKSIELTFCQLEPQERLKYVASWKLDGR